MTHDEYDKQMEEKYPKLKMMLPALRVPWENGYLLCEQEWLKKAVKSADELVKEYFTMQDGGMAGSKLFTETEFREALAKHGIQGE